MGKPQKEAEGKRPQGLPKAATESQETTQAQGADRIIAFTYRHLGLPSTRAFPRMASNFWEIYHDFVIAPYSIYGGEPGRRPVGLLGFRDGVEDANRGHRVGLRWDYGDYGGLRWDYGEYGDT